MGGKVGLLLSTNSLAYKHLLLGRTRVAQPAKKMQIINVLHVKLGSAAEIAEKFF
jgi:hypothetical protein